MKIKVTRLFTEFFESEQASGVIPLLSAGMAMLLANSRLGDQFLEFWHIKLGWDWGSIHLQYSIGHWVNGGLMAIFFLLIGLEIEREFYIGELSNIKNASLPVVAAIGGVLTPALMHFLLNRGTDTQSGFGIPMATDIAFALGILALLGSKVPVSLKIFLTAFAIIDDLIAIAVIVIFYATGFSLGYLTLAGLFVGKPLGIFVFSWLAIKTKLVNLPEGVSPPSLDRGRFPGWDRLHHVHLHYTACLWRRPGCSELKNRHHERFHFSRNGWLLPAASGIA